MKRQVNLVHVHTLIYNDSCVFSSCFSYVHHTSAIPRGARRQSHCTFFHILFHREVDIWNSIWSFPAQIHARHILVCNYSWLWKTFRSKAALFLYGRIYENLVNHYLKQYQIPHSIKFWYMTYLNEKKCIFSKCQNKEAVWKISSPLCLMRSVSDMAFLLLIEMKLKG